MQIIMKPNECLVIGFIDGEEEVFIISYNDIKNGSEIKIKALLSDNDGRKDIIYHEISTQFDKENFIDHREKDK